MKGYRQVNNYTFENDLLLLSCQLKCTYNKNENAYSSVCVL